jgi:hypothetical protein
MIPQVDERSQRVPVNGNQRTMNLDQVLFSNIMRSEYFTEDLFALKTWSEVLHEANANVKYLGISFFQSAW